MLFVRYAITLPADYDMTRIAERVAAKADHWDRRAGLHLKAFCTAERGRGAPHNVYAPFYVWADPTAFADFLTGPEYAGLSASFGPVPAFARRGANAIVTTVIARRNGRALTTLLGRKPRTMLEPRGGSPRNSRAPLRFARFSRNRP